MNRIFPREKYKIVQDDRFVVLYFNGRSLSRGFLSPYYFGYSPSDVGYIVPKRMLIKTIRCNSRAREEKIIEIRNNQKQFLSFNLHKENVILKPVDCYVSEKDILSVFINGSGLTNYFSLILELEAVI